VNQRNPVSPTPYSDLNDVLGHLTAGIEAVLDDAFVGAYLQGSFAVGDFDRHSDVDFVVATDRELLDEEVQALQMMHGRVYDLDCSWAQHLEGSYFPKDVLRSCHQRGKLLWYLEHGSRSLILSEHCNTAVVRWVVREHGVTLAGPSPVALVDPIPAETLRAEILATMRGWYLEILTEPERFSNRFYQGFIVLSYCRMLHDLHTGRIESKYAGAKWAKAMLDSSWADLIDRAWEGRPNPSLSVRQPADSEDFERTLDFVRYVIGLIPRFAPGAESGTTEAAE
jgi:hypothetical protein